MDPLLLGDILDEFDIRYVRTYLDLDPELRLQMIDRVSDCAPRRQAIVPERWKAMEAAAAHRCLRTPTSNAEGAA